VAIAATVLSSQTNGARTTLDTAARVQAGLTGFHYAIATLLILGLFSLFFALRLRDVDPAAAKKREESRPKAAAVERLANAVSATGGSQD
jgi:hypothetical protein